MFFYNKHHAKFGKKKKKKKAKAKQHPKTELLTKMYQ